LNRKSTTRKDYPTTSYPRKDSKRGATPPNLNIKGPKDKEKEKYQPRKPSK